MSDIALPSFLFWDRAGIREIRSRAPDHLSGDDRAVSFRQNDYALHISLPDGKRESRDSLLRDFPKKEAIAHQESEKLIGRLSFSQTLLFGKIARTQRTPLYKKIHRMLYNARLSASESAFFSWWDKVIRSPPRVCRPCAHSRDWLVYTDAATTPPRILALRCRGNAKTPRLDSSLSMDVDPAWVYHFRATCLIFGLELLALVEFLEDEAGRLSGCFTWF